MAFLRRCRRKWCLSAYFRFHKCKHNCDNIAKGNIFGSEGLIGIPIHWEKTVFGGIDYSNTALIASSIIAIVPIAFATMMEHIGDICAISSTTGNNYIQDPGLHRTLTGDGLATTVASLLAALQTQHMAKIQAYLHLQRFMTHE